VAGARGAGAAADEARECETWDRCWCVLEFAIRFFAEKQVRADFSCHMIISR
jgi:hypothetical protein